MAYSLIKKAYVCQKTQELNNRKVRINTTFERSRYSKYQRQTDKLNHIKMPKAEEKLVKI